MYEAVTHNIRVKVEPAYLPEHSDAAERRWVWAYTVEVTNEGPATVRLRNRHWRITDANGATQEVRGPGVVGEQPAIPPGATFRYTSGCPLSTPSGIMVGAYEMEGPGGERFNVDVPAFSLDTPEHAPTVN